MEIRRMTPEDYDAIHALWMSCPGMGLNSLDDSRDGIGRFLERNPDTCFVAVEARHIIGAILAGNDGRRGYLYHTAVHPSMQGRGIGKALVGAAMTALHALGIHKTALVVFSGNAQGNAFWEKMGFTVRADLVYRNRALDEMIRIDT
ncbi:MAG: GNAT family N-acetyltransferase [Oscillospiraceae bacterium]|nr:GNAT family N-acetyltransferase [Oscillospiraceae bacterium]